MGLQPEGGEPEKLNMEILSPEELFNKAGKPGFFLNALIYLEKGSNPNINNEKDEKLLHHLVKKLLYLSLVEGFIDAGANINAQNINGETPLMVAVKSLTQEDGTSIRADMVSMLISKGASVENIDKEGNTAIHLAIMESHLEALEKLLTAEKVSEVINVLNNKSETALDLAKAIPAKETSSMEEVPGYSVGVFEKDMIIAALIAAGGLTKEQLGLSEVQLTKIEKIYKMTKLLGSSPEKLKALSPRNPVKPSTAGVGDPSTLSKLQPAHQPENPPGSKEHQKASPSNILPRPKTLG